MPYAFMHDVPANEQIYREIRALLPKSSPPGLISHVAIVREGGLRYVDVWATKSTGSTSATNASGRPSARCTPSTG
jgi:hypothetical protein